MRDRFEQGQAGEHALRSRQYWGQDAGFASTAAAGFPSFDDDKVERSEERDVIELHAPAAGSRRLRKRQRAEGRPQCAWWRVADQAATGRDSRPDEPARVAEDSVTARRSGRGPVSAEELMAELEADEEYQAAIKLQDDVRERRAAEWRRAEKPLVDELRRAGFEVESAWDLVNTSTPYPAALPVLLEHLGRRYPDRVREGIARALAVGRDAMFGWDRLVHLYRDEPAGSDAKDGIAVALAAICDDDVVDELIELARDAEHGESRILLLRALKRSRASQARLELERMAADPVLGQQARALHTDRPA